MKRFLAAVIAIVTVLSVTACSEKYKPVKSTKEEAKCVMSFTVGEEEYEVRYELYRALFLNYKNQVDGGDSAAWSGAESEKYITEINSLILEKAAEIYSVLALARELGFKPYSKDVEKQIKALIEESVDGVSFKGDYDAYLAHLKEININYSVQTLMLRYRLMQEKIFEYYVGFEDQALGHIDGDFQYSEEDVRAYYNSEESARFLYAFIGKKGTTDSKERAEALREKILAAETDYDVACLIISASPVIGPELLNGKNVTGTVIGKNVTGVEENTPYLDAAFSLEAGEVSEVIECGGENPGYYIIYSLEKSEEHFAACYDTVKASYLENVLGGKLNEFSEKTAKSVRYTDEFSEIDHKNISMD